MESIHYNSLMKCITSFALSILLMFSVTVFCPKVILLSSNYYCRVYMFWILILIMAVIFKPWNTQSFVVQSLIFTFELRTIFVFYLSLGVLTVETNQDRDRDIIFQTVKTFLTVEMSVFELSRLRVSIETLTKIETLGYQDCWDLAF